jgi:hypothetical protein
VKCRVLEAGVDVQFSIASKSPRKRLPTVFARSYTTAGIPARASVMAADRPAGPAPTIATGSLPRGDLSALTAGNRA